MQMIYECSEYGFSLYLTFILYYEIRDRKRVKKHAQGVNSINRQCAFVPSAFFFL